MLVLTGTTRVQPAIAQRQMWTERLVADVEIAAVDSYDHQPFQCGRAAFYATVRARVVAIVEGGGHGTDLRIAWLACGTTQHELEAETRGRRFRLRLFRHVHPAEVGLTPERQPRWYVRGEPTRLSP